MSPLTLDLLKFLPYNALLRNQQHKKNLRCRYNYQEREPNVATAACPNIALRRATNFMNARAKVQERSDHFCNLLYTVQIWNLPPALTAA